MHATTALHALIPHMETRAGLHELAGALYDAASEAFDAHDHEQWRELGDLADYVHRVAEAADRTPEPAGLLAATLERRRIARAAIAGN